MQKDSIEKFIDDLRKQNDKYAAKLNKKLNREFVKSITQELKRSKDAR